MTKDQYNQEISQDDTIVGFSAPWCGSCKALEPILKSITEVKTLKINIEDAMGVAESLQIRSLPTIAYYVNGELKIKESGVKSKDYILNKLKELKP